MKKGECQPINRVREKDGKTAGQLHLNNPIQNMQEIGVVPACFETLGMNANTRRLFLTQEIEANVAQDREVFVSMTLSNT